MTKRFRVKKGWDVAGQEGEYYDYVRVKGMKWAIVLFDGEEDPSLYKADGIEICSIQWHAVPIKPTE